MLNTYIQNQGFTETIIHDNNNNHVYSTKWDANYDGNKAIIHIKTDNDGKHNQYNMKLDHHDLAQILNYKTIDIPLDKRLKMAFKKSRNRPHKPPSIEILKTIDEIIPDEINKASYISSPMSDEEYIVPLMVKKTTTDLYSPLRKRKRRKSHVTRKIYKKSKSSKSSKSPKSRKSTKSHKTPKTKKTLNSQKKTISIGDLL